jgi:hypothetical protein
MDLEWPEEPVDLTTAAKLFVLAGKQVDRTNLGRFVASRNFPVITQGRRQLVQAKLLFDVYCNDFSRKVMAGETGSVREGAGLAPRSSGAPGGGVAAAPVAGGGLGQRDRSNPKLRESELKAQALELDLAERLRKVVPIEEVAAAQAEAIAQLRAAFSQAIADHADIMLPELGLPAHRSGALRLGLKRFALIGQGKFAEAVTPLIALPEEVTGAARIRLDRLATIALELLSRELEHPARQHYS